MTQRRSRGTGSLSRCPICKKPIGHAPRAKSRSGKVCHATCLKQAKAAGAGKTTPTAPRQWNIAAAERAFNRNKEAVESGETFRGHQPSGWRLGGSPSSAGQIRR